MKKLTILNLENYENPVVLYNKDDIVEAIHDKEIAYFDKETRKEFKKRFGFKPEEFESKRKDLDDELIEEIEEFIEENKQYPKQVCSSPYCEDVYTKESIHEILKNGGLLFWNNLEWPDENDIGFDYNNYLLHWDGSNWKAIKIVGGIYEIEAEKVDFEKDDRRKLTTYTYKTKNGTEFKVLSSWYQGVLDEISEEDFEKIAEEAK